MKETSPMVKTIMADLSEFGPYETWQFFAFVVAADSL